DGRGHFTGDAVASSTIGYEDGSVEITFKPGHAPASAADLAADYSWRGLLDVNLLVYAYHFYIFESITDDGKLIFKNPWGDMHPQPTAPADFRRLFQSISTNAVPK